MRRTVESQLVTFHKLGNKCNLDNLELCRFRCAARRKEIIMTSHGPWIIVSSNQVYRDPWVLVQRDEVIRTDGKPGTYAVIHIKPGVCVLAMDAERNVYLTEEFHYAVGQTTIECVSGGRDDDEPPLGAAQRELREELGIEAEQWLDLGRPSIHLPLRFSLRHNSSWLNTSAWSRLHQKAPN